MKDSMKLVDNPVATIGEMLYDSLDNQLGREVELLLCPICAPGADGKRVALVNYKCPVCHSDFNALFNPARSPLNGL
jgi:uncharacterized protein (UPF0212 family)